MEYVYYDPAIDEIFIWQYRVNNFIEGYWFAYKGTPKYKLIRCPLLGEL